MCYEKSIKLLYSEDRCNKPIAFPNWHFCEFHLILLQIFQIFALLQLVLGPGNKSISEGQVQIPVDHGLVGCIQCCE